MYVALCSMSVACLTSRQETGNVCVTSGCSVYITARCQACEAPASMVPAKMCARQPICVLAVCVSYFIGRICDIQSTGHALSVSLCLHVLPAFPTRAHCHTSHYSALADLPGHHFPTWRRTQQLCMAAPFPPRLPRHATPVSKSAVKMRSAPIQVAT